MAWDFEQIGVTFKGLLRVSWLNQMARHDRHLIHGSREQGFNIPCIVSIMVNYMGEGINNEVGIDRKSLCQSEIAKTQADLRQEYRYYEERKRELEFLEKGGNPLDFKLCPQDVVNVPSTSPGEHLVSSKATCVNTKAPQGREQSSDGDIVPKERSGSVFPRSSSPPPSRLDGNQKEKELSDSEVGCLKWKFLPYTRRKRSKLVSTSIKSQSNDSAHMGVGNRSSSSFFCNSSQITKDICKTNTVKDQSVSSIGTFEITCPNDNVVNALQDEGITGFQTKVGQCDTDDNFTPSINLQLQNTEFSQHCRTHTGQDPSISALADDMSSKKKPKNCCTGKHSGLIPTEAQKVNAASNSKDLESESSRKFNPTVNAKQQTSLESNHKLDISMPGENSEIKVVDDNVSTSSCQIITKNNSCTENIVPNKRSSTEKEAIPCKYVTEIGYSDRKRKMTSEDQFGDISEYKMTGSYTHIESLNVMKSNCELPDTFNGVNTTATNTRTSQLNNLELPNKVREDSVLKEAKTIKDKHKRIRELSAGNFSLDKPCKTHWDYVLEEMAWLANDFMQERIWKLTAASQVCRWVASAVRCRFNEQNLYRIQRKVACTLSNAIMQFWESAEETSKYWDEQCSRPSFQCTVQGYASRFLKDNSLRCLSVQIETPKTLDMVSDLGDLEIPSTEENLLFYTISPGAMERYRKLAESELSEQKKIGNNKHPKEVGPYVHATKAEVQSHGNVCQEKMGCRKSSSSPMKGQQNSPMWHTADSYELRQDLPCKHSIKIGDQPSMLIGKMPYNILGLSSIPTRRARTASKKRVHSQLASGSSGGVQLGEKVNSSRETKEFQHNQHTIHEELQIWKDLEVESKRVFGEQLSNKSTEVLSKAKRKQLISTSEKRQTCHPMMVSEQRDNSTERSDNHQVESNECDGSTPQGQHAARKSSTLKILRETSNKAIIPRDDSLVASRASNKSNKKKFTKKISILERHRESKIEKMPTGPSGRTWLPFEDQALLEIVHDLGPNWEHVCGAINSILKRNFLKSNQCKERYEVLLEKDAGDESDSNEDHLDPSQYSPFTLPYISKENVMDMSQHSGCTAETETLIDRFQKIIKIVKQQDALRCQNDSLDRKQINPAHGSHFLTFTQVSSDGGPLMPLDLCASDAITIGYQIFQPTALMVPVAVCPSYSATPELQGSSSMMISNSLPALPTQLTPTRNSQSANMPRPASATVTEQQRVRQLSQVLSSCKNQRSNLSVPGALPASDSGVRTLYGGRSMSTVSRMNTSTRTASPASKRIDAAATNLSVSGHMLPSSRVVQRAATMNAGAASSQGNSRMTSPEALHRVLPQRSEGQRQVTKQKLPMQVLQRSNHTYCQRTGSSNQMCFPAQNSSIQCQQRQQVSQPSRRLSYPGHPHILESTHVSGMQQHAVNRLAKEQVLSKHPQLGRKPQKAVWHEVAVLKSSGSNSQSDTPPCGSSRSTKSSSSQKDVSSQSASLPKTRQQESSVMISSDSEKHKKQRTICRGLQSSASGVEATGVPTQGASTVQGKYLIQRQHPRLNAHDMTGQKLLKGSSHVISSSTTSGFQVGDQPPRSSSASSPITPKHRTKRQKQESQEPRSESSNRRLQLLKSEAKTTAVASQVTPTAQRQHHPKQRMHIRHVNKTNGQEMVAKKLMTDLSNVIGTSKPENQVSEKDKPSMELAHSQHVISSSAMVPIASQNQNRQHGLQRPDISSDLSSRGAESAQNEESKDSDGNAGM